jgi:hypothetical protein
MIEFITASHDDSILTKNLANSSIFEFDYNLTVFKGYNNIPRAYNIKAPSFPNICYLHHDVFLPAPFEKQVRKSIEFMKTVDPNWGVLGVAGVRLENGVKKNYGYIRDRDREWGSPGGLPAEVDTLDELLLITHGDFKFDEQFDLHFYGADICMQAKLQGRKCYAINAYCHHNSGLPLGYRSESFRECERRFRAKYIDHLPISTTCSIVI